MISVAQSAWARVRGVLVFLPLLFIASAASQLPAGMLWVAESGGILNVRTGEAQVAFEIPHPHGISATAVNDVNGDLWAYASRQLHQYSRSGEPLLQMDAAPRTPAGEPADIVADGVSGNLWLAIGRELYRYDFSGVLQQQIKRSGEISALDLDRARS
ncbi:MAG: hypothetical protein ACREEM_32920 [Blastocatellia bacterium]